jgi:hypothetical protein
MIRAIIGGMSTATIRVSFARTGLVKRKAPQALPETLYIAAQLRHSA